MVNRDSHGPSTRCPAVRVPEVQACPAGELSELLAWIHAGGEADSTAPLAFQRGTALDGGARLDLCKQDLGPDGARAVIAALPRAPRIETILLGTDAIGDRGAATLGSLVANHPDQLRTLYLGCNRITSVGLTALGKGIPGSRVDALWLKRNPLGRQGARALVPLLTPPHGIEVLDLFNTELGDDGLAILHEVLGHPAQTLQHVYLGGNGLTAASASRLATWLATTRQLRGLYLSVNHLGDEGIITLLDGLRANRGVEHLALGSNGLSAVAVEALEGVLTTHPDLATLELDRSPSTFMLGAKSNHLGDAGATALAKVLRECPRLRQLDLSHNGVTSRGALHLERGVRGSGLVALRLGRGIARRIRRRIRLELEANARRLDLTSVQVPAHVARIRSVYRTPPVASQ